MRRAPIKAVPKVRQADLRLFVPDLSPPQFNRTRVISCYRPLRALMSVWSFQVRTELMRHPCLLI